MILQKYFIFFKANQMIYDFFFSKYCYHPQGMLNVSFKIKRKKSNVRIHLINVFDNKNQLFHI